VWSSSSGSTLLVFAEHHSSPVSSASWSPDGSKIATASHDGTARVWSSGNGSTLLTLTGHSSGVVSVAWSPDGSKIASASSDGTARVWNSSSGSTAADAFQEIPAMAFGKLHGRQMVARSPLHFMMELLACGAAAAAARC